MRDKLDEVLWCVYELVKLAKLPRPHRSDYPGYFPGGLEVAEAGLIAELNLILLYET